MKVLELLNFFLQKLNFQYLKQTEKLKSRKMKNGEEDGCPDLMVLMMWE